MQLFQGEMKSVNLTIERSDMSWDVARAAAYDFACEDGGDPMLMSWFDQTTGKFSPSCCKCDLRDGSAWEIYGKNHGGRLRISINNDLYVFIYT